MHWGEWTRLRLNSASEQGRRRLQVTQEMALGPTDSRAHQPAISEVNRPTATHGLSGVRECRPPGVYLSQQNQLTNKEELAVAPGSCLSSERSRSSDWTRMTGDLEETTGQPQQPRLLQDDMQQELKLDATDKRGNAGDRTSDDVTRRVVRGCSGRRPRRNKEENAKPRVQSTQAPRHTGQKKCWKNTVWSDDSWFMRSDWLKILDNQNFV